MKKDESQLSQSEAVTLYCETVVLLPFGHKIIIAIPFFLQHVITKLYRNIQGQIAI